MPRKLSYFNTNGLAEPVRYMLHYGKLEFEDVRYSEWPILDVTDTGAVNLLPSDIWKQAQLDAHVLNIYDLITKSRSYFNVDVNPNKNNIYHKEKEETLKFFLSRFEKELKAGNGHFAGKLSWADFVLVGFIEFLSLYLEQPIEKDYPTIVALISKIHSLPGVKEYIAKREPYKLDSVKRN